MILLVAVAIVLVVLLSFLLGARLARRRYRRPRRRDATPLRFQQRWMVAAALRRVRRGLRFPTVAEKIRHKKFVRALTRLMLKQTRITTHPGTSNAA